MNMKFFLLLILLVVCARQGFSLTCPTCKGSNCYQEVKEMECNRHSLPLPGENKQDKISSADKEYRCLNLKYGPDDDVTELKQCVEIEVGNDICKYLSKHLNIKECSVSNHNLMGRSVESNRETYSANKLASPSPSADASSSSSSETSSSSSSETSSSSSSDTSSSSSSDTSSSIGPPSSTNNPNSSGIHTSSVLTLMMAVLVWIHL